MGSQSHDPPAGVGLAAGDHDRGRAGEEPVDDEAAERGQPEVEGEATHRSDTEPEQDRRRDDRDDVGVDDGVPNGAPVANAHVRLLDSHGEFTAELPTNADGQFRFFAAPGSWTLVVLAPGVREELSVSAALGVPADLVIQI